MEGEHIGGSREMVIRIQDSRGVLADIKKEFEEGDEKTVKVAELKRLEQEGKMIEEFVQEFRRAVRESRYEERSLVEEFEQEMNRTTYQRLMKSEW